MTKQPFLSFLLLLVLMLFVRFGMAQDNDTPPNAVDYVALANVGDTITFDVVFNDTNTDGSIDAPSVAITSRPSRHVPSFDGIDNHITWGNLGLDWTPRITKLIRFKTTDAAGVLFDWECIGDLDGGLTTFQGNLQLRCGFVAAGVKIVDIISTAEAANGQWDSAGFTYDGSELTPYFDGEPAQSISISNDALFHNYTRICGKTTLANTWFFSGELADFVIYGQALTTEEVTEYDNWFLRIEALVLWGKMDETDYGNGLADAGGNGNIGTPIGVITILDNSVVNPHPVNGVVNNEDGSVTDTPNSGFHGSDRFLYTVSDDDGGVSNVTTVTIDILDPRLTDTDGDGLFDAIDSMPTVLSFPTTYPLYFDVNATGFAFPLLVEDNRSDEQLAGLINFGDATTPFPQQYDPLLNDWVAAPNLLPNVGYLAHGLEEENADCISGELTDDVTLDLDIGHNLIALPFTTPYPSFETSIVAIFADNRGMRVTPALTTSDFLLKNHLYWIESNATFSTDTSTWFIDADGDTLADDWEQIIIDASLTDDMEEIDGVEPADDFDQDLLANGYEFRVDTDPTMVDSDQDSLPDGWEVNFSRIAIPILPPPLVWWKLNRNDGGFIINEQGSDFEGIISGAPTFENGLFIDTIDDVTKVAVFDQAIGLSSNSSVAIANSDDLDLINGWNAFSISLWAKVNPLDSGVLFRRDNDLGETIISMRMNNLGEYIMAVTDNGNLEEVITIGETYDDGQWHHLLVSLSSTSPVVFYIDGQRIGAIALTTPFDLDGLLPPLVLGNQEPKNDGITGLVDDFRIFNTSLNLLHAKMLYQPISDDDQDGLNDLNEYRFGSDPNNPDTDDDDLSDGDEVAVYTTDPAAADSDSDQIPDGWEVLHELDPLANDAGLDPDGDGITNLQEFLNGTDPAPPRNVTNVQLVCVKTGEFTLSWAPSTSADTATVLVQLDPDPTLIDIGLVNEHTFANLANGLTYTCAIHVRDTSGNTSNATPFSVILPAIPDASPSLAGFVEDGAAVLILGRSPSPDVDEYLIEQETFDDNTGTWSGYTPSTVSPVPAWTDADFRFISVPGLLVVGSRYRFRATSVDHGEATMCGVTNDTGLSPVTEFLVNETFMDTVELKRNISLRQIELQLDMDDDGVANEISASVYQARPGTPEERVELQRILQETARFCRTPGNSYSDSPITVTQNPPEPSDTGFVSFTVSYDQQGWNPVDLSGVFASTAATATRGNGIPDAITQDHLSEMTQAYNLLTTWTPATSTEVVASMTNKRDTITPGIKCDDGERLGNNFLGYFRSYQNAVDCLIDRRFAFTDSSIAPSTTKIDVWVTRFNSEWRVSRDLRWLFQADFTWTPLVDANDDPLPSTDVEEYYSLLLGPLTPMSAEDSPVTKQIQPRTMNTFLNTLSNVSPSQFFNGSNSFDLSYKDELPATAIFFQYFKRMKPRSAVLNGVVFSANEQTFSDNKPLVIGIGESVDIQGSIQYCVDLATGTVPFETPASLTFTSPAPANDEAYIDETGTTFIALQPGPYTIQAQFHSGTSTTATIIAPKIEFEVSDSRTAFCVN